MLGDRSVYFPFEEKAGFRPTTPLATFGPRWRNDRGSLVSRNEGLLGGSYQLLQAGLLTLLLHALSSIRPVRETIGRVTSPARSSY